MRWLQPLTNVNTPDGVLYRWYRLIPDGFDLYPEAIGTNEVGDPPKWLEHQEDVTDLDTSLSPEWCHGIHRGHEFTERWLRWALHRGIAPGTPFLVRIGEPKWYKCSYEYDEWDCEYDIKVVWVQPRTPEQSLKSWARFLDAMIRGRDVHCDALEKLRHLRETDENALSIRTDWYYSNGYYDEMSPPTGLTVQLWTSHTLYGNKHPLGAQLASGRSDRGDYQEAFRNLLKTCAERYPKLSPSAIIRAQGSDRRLHLTRYEHITLDTTT